MIYATEFLSKFAYGLKYEDLTEETVAATKMYIADYLAAAYAGKKINQQFNQAVENTIYEMGGKCEASALFSSMKLPAANAAFLNASYAHGADMDDGNRKSMGHIGAHVISAVFALAETLDVSGKDVIVAINVGFDVFNRIAAAVQPGLIKRGFHSTGTAGAVACGAACAKLLGLSQEGIYNSIALSAVQASGLLLVTESGQACKPINPANAAKTGIFSAKLIEKGVVSSANPLESSKGWFHAMSDEVDESMITDGLGKTFTICESYLKPYPACRHTHCGIEAAQKLRTRIIADYGENFSAENVKQVRIYIYENAIRIAGQIKIPEVASDSKFSIHYSFATALLRGHYKFADLEVDNISPAQKMVIDKTELIPDAEMENREKGIRGARVELDMGNKTYTETVLIPKGDRANPFQWTDMEEKMWACMENRMTLDEIKTVIGRICALEEVPRFTSVKMLLP